jgi:hypothetical protein
MPVVVPVEGSEQDTAVGYARVRLTRRSRAERERYRVRLGCVFL